MHDYSSHNIPSGKFRQKKNPQIKKFIFFLVILAAVFSFFNNFRKSGNTKLNDIGSHILSFNFNYPSQDKLLSDIKGIISKSQGSYYVYIYDLNSKKGFGINENTVLTAASLNKVPILASLYYLAGKGEIDLEKVVILQEEDIQDYGSGSIRYDPPGTPYSLKTLARLMMEKSDNTAAHILSMTVGMDKIQDLVNTWGLIQTDMTDNYTSAKDMEIIMEKMYKGEITTPALNTEMLNFMDSSDFDDRIPRGIPATVKFYHKTGDEIGKLHDVAIIDFDKRPYFLGVLTSDIIDEPIAKENIAKISRLVYEYMKL